MNKNEIPLAPERIKKFEQMGLGMFVHFGLYSTLNSGEWVYHFKKPPMEQYTKMAETFSVPTMAEIVKVGKSAGCKYICLTTRHHDGFSLYDTKGLNTYDAPHTPCKRDLIAEFVDECRKVGIVPFFYHTTLDWWNKDFDEDFNKYLDYLYESVKILCTNYGKIGGLWFDGNWSKENADWKEERLYKMIRKHQPDAMIINNTGIGKRGEIGQEEIDAVTFERGMPEPVDLRGKAKYMTGEMCETLCDHWGIADDINFKSVKLLIEELCESRKVGANFLLNIGPAKDGTVPIMQKAIMQSIGHWMSVYAKAIYNGRPYLSYQDKRDFILKDVNDEKTAYLFSLNPGQSQVDENVSLESTNTKAPTFENVEKEVQTVKWLDNNQELDFYQKASNLKVNLTGFAYGQNLCVRVAEIKFK